MYQAYTRIFSRLGLEFRAVQADTGSIGGSASHEFHVLADSGEDAIAFSDGSDYAANVEMAAAIAPQEARAQASQTMQTVDTPGQHSIEEICQFLKLNARQTIKTLVVKADEQQESDLLALVVRGGTQIDCCCLWSDLQGRRDFKVYS